MQGFKHLNHPALRYYVYIPLLINLVIFIAGLYGLMHWWHYLQAWLNHWLPHWLQWLDWLFVIFYGLAGIIIVFYLTSLLANIVAAPFNGLLAEKCLELHHALPVKTNTRWAWLTDLPLSLIRELRKLAYVAPRAIGCLILFLIPVIQIIATPLWLLFSSWSLALEYFDYPVEHHHGNFAELRAQMRKRRLLQLGFGGAALLFTLIPVVNWLVMPAAVIGASIMWAKEYQSSN
ncbi:MAG: sulfate transporter CysZ [Coxiellaceae bacterium]|nr:MAG: sulfate transporter CysZ [Coxiellaceae bacterium]